MLSSQIVICVSQCVIVNVLIREDILYKIVCVFVFSEILVVGTGDRIVRLSPEVIKHMKEHNIMLEVQDTVSGFPVEFLLGKDWYFISFSLDHLPRRNKHPYPPELNASLK